MWQELIVETTDQIQAAWIERAEAKWTITDLSPGVDKTVGSLSEVLVTRMNQPALHMTKGVLVGDEIYKALTTVVVQDKHFLTSERRGICPYFRVLAVGEGMLNV